MNVLKTVSVISTVTNNINAVTYAVPATITPTLTVTIIVIPSLNIIDSIRIIINN